MLSVAPPTVEASRFDERTFDSRSAHQEVAYELLEVLPRETRGNEREAFCFGATGDFMASLKKWDDDPIFSMMNGNFISRSSLYEDVEFGLARNPIVALMGPRQVGRTSLGRLFIYRPGNSFDFESPIDLERLSVEPFGALDQLEGCVLIDEIQRMPQYFE